MAALLQRAKADNAVPGTRMGIATTSFVDVPQQDAAGIHRHGRDTYEFLEKCHSFGAGGIQAQLNGDLTKLRNRAE